MKNLITALLLLAIGFKSIAQTSPANTPVSQDQIDQWKKNAKTYRAISITMVSVGTLMIIGGIYSGVNTDGDGTGAGIVALTGIALNLGSIPFTVLSAVNRRKAKNATVSFSGQPLYTPLVAGSKMRAQPAVSVSIPLGR